jgi:mRNA interferase MazF
MVSGGERIMAATRFGRGEEGKGYPRRGEIYLTALDPALGHEVKKTRPALVIQNNITNQYSSTTIVAAITSTINTPPYPNEVIVSPGVSGLRVASTVRLDQIRTVDCLRLLKRLGALDAVTMRQVDSAIKVSLGLIAF